MNRIRTLLALIAITLPFTTLAEDVSEAKRILCGINDLTLCVESGDCFEITPADMNLPQFIVIDRKQQTVSTTRASQNQRSTKVGNMAEVENRLLLQGIENERAYSFVIEQDLGLLTAAVARDGITLSVFGACTDAEVD